MDVIVAFAAHYLLPPEFMQAIPESNKWDIEKALFWANKLKVSTSALAIALYNYCLINSHTADIIPLEFSIDISNINVDNSKFYS